MQDHRVQLAYGSYCEPSELFIGKSVAEAYAFRAAAWAIPEDAVSMRTPIGFATYAASSGTILKAGDSLEWIRLSKPAAEKASIGMARVKMDLWEDTHERYVGMMICELRSFLWEKVPSYHAKRQSWHGVKRLAESYVIKTGDNIEFV